MTLLYRTAEWHAFAKLWLHTESTLQHLKRLTTELGQLMRKFRDATQSGFATFELLKETGARKRRQKSGKGKEKAVAGNTSGHKPKILNLFMHWGITSALSVSLVEQMGSQTKWSVIFLLTVSDFFTTFGCQGELAHKVVK